MNKTCKALIVLIIIQTLIIPPVSIGEAVYNNNIKYNKESELELLYDDVWGSIYNAIENQCDSTPLLTGNGLKINPKIASQLRWIAISQDMLNCKYRARLLKYTRIDRYKGKICYGDTICIDSPHEKINGWWIVQDTKNARYVKSIDFLQTEGDKSLYNNKWSGKFDDIKIYRKKNN